MPLFEQTTEYYMKMLDELDLDIAQQDRERRTFARERTKIEESLGAIPVNEILRL